MTEVQIQTAAAALVESIAADATQSAGGDPVAEAAILQQIAHATMERAQILAKRNEDDMRTFVAAKEAEYVAHRTSEAAKRSALKAARAAIEK